MPKKTYRGRAFYAFSSFVMAALGRLPPAQGVASMQSMNIVAPTPGFMIGFLGTAAVSLVLGGLALGDLGRWSGRVRLVAALLYLAGVIGVTAARNVPMNNALAKLDPESSEALAYWPQYLAQWTAWNHVRTLAGALSLVLLLLVAYVGDR